MKIILSCLLLTSLWISDIRTVSNQFLISDIEYVNGKYLKDGRAVNGDIIDYHENEILKFRYAALDGRLHGEAITYHPNGKIKSIRNYTFNKLFGEFVEFDEGGNVLVKFKVDLNAYQKGENVFDIELKKGNRLKSKGEGIIYFISNRQETYRYSEEISILEQTNYFINDIKGSTIFKNY